MKKESMMTNVRLIGAAVLSLALVGPVMAAHHVDHRRDTRDLPVQDALHFGYSAGECGYHSGYGGLYGDGYYPGNVCEDGGNHLID
jgi:hypothetical protein